MYKLLIYGHTYREDVVDQPYTAVYCFNSIEPAKIARDFFLRGNLIVSEIIEDKPRG